MFCMNGLTRRTLCGNRPVRGKLGECERGVIVDEYLALTPMIALAGKYEVSRQAIHEVLKVAGIDTSKGRRVKRSCAWCGEPVYRVKSQVRGRKRVFCFGKDCYFDWMRAGGNHRDDSYGRRVGREVVGQYFELNDGMIAHHDDGNNLNNRVENLKVFRDHSEHMKYHFQVHSGVEITVPVLWDGSAVDA